MRNDTESAMYEDLVVRLKSRFPLLSQLIGQFGTDSPSERIPWFFALLLSAATSHDRGACCFVLNKSPGTTAIAAILLALIKLQEEFPELAEDYARTGLSIGQRVKVKPSDYVYEYDGLWKEHPGKFRLKVQGERSWRSFPMNEVLRLELTDRVRPKGKLTSPLGAFERSQLDDLLDFDTCGNNSLFRNSVLLYMPQTRFSKAADEIALSQRATKSFERLSRYLPWGSIGAEGELKPDDSFQVRGEPIIAVSKVPEDLAKASSAAEEGTKIVLANGARGLARDLQAYDDIADRQRLVIFASPEEAEALDLLRESDCPVWYMSPEEVLIGEPSATRRKRRSLVGATIRAADIRQSARVEIVPCRDNILQSVAESLGRAATLVSESEEANEAEEILGRLRGVLLECSECCFGIGGKTEDKLHSVQDLVARHGRWLPPEFTGEIDDAINELNDGMSGRNLGQHKAHALLTIIHNETDENWGVVTRAPQTAETIRAGLRELSVEVPVVPISRVSPDIEFSGVVVPAWLNSERFTRLKAMAVTPDIRALTYPFEAEWVSRHLARERRWERSNRMDVEKRSSILGIDSRFLTSTMPHEPEEPIREIEPDLPIFRLEDRVTQRRMKRPSVAHESEDSREAQYVQFFGDCYTLLTEWAELPRLNKLIDSANTDDAGLEQVRASQLVPGDFVLFRASEDKEFIRTIAEDILGLEEYTQVRAMAERWRSSLRLIGESPSEVQQVLKAYGLSRALPTVVGWLHSPHHIGPGNFGDIAVIARAAGDAELLSTKQDVELAITHIRSTHIVAGRQLTQLILGELDGHLSNLDDEPVLLDFNYGAAWVVQVDKVDVERRDYPLNLVNRLLWADDVTS